jgi:phosphate transport system substrate-binding protein
MTGRQWKLTIFSYLLLGGAAMTLGSCEEGSAHHHDAGGLLTGELSMDGSSSAYPLTLAAARRFRRIHPLVWTKVESSSSGQGLARLLAGEIQLADSSRRMKPEEAQAATQKGIEIVEFALALDGIAIVANSGNTWAEHLTLPELKRICEPGTRLQLWSEVRPQWPSVPLQLYGPTASSGTFDGFTTAVTGKAGRMRSDYLAHEDEETLAYYLRQDVGGLGFLSYGRYRRLERNLRALPLASAEEKPVEPSRTTIESGAYPLTRTLYLYSSRAALASPELAAFVRYYLENSADIASDCGYVPLPSSTYARQIKEFRTQAARRSLEPGPDTRELPPQGGR